MPNPLAVPPAPPADRVRFVLIRPALSENVGSALRALVNMGFARLRVAGMDRYDRERARALAAGAGGSLDRIEFFPAVPEAIADCVRVYAVTRRRRRHRYTMLAPRLAAERIWAQTARGPVALLFGCEADGLSNPELELAQELITIPTAEEMGSLNLAQAVLLVAYELFLASGAAPPPRDDTFPPAPVAELELMLEHMERTLRGLGFIRPANLAIRDDLRQIFGNRELNRPQLQILRGIFRRIETTGPRAPESAPTIRP